MFKVAILASIAAITNAADLEEFESTYEANLGPVSNSGKGFDIS